MTNLEKKEIYRKLEKDELIELLIEAQEKLSAQQIQYYPIWQYIPTPPIPSYPTITYGDGTK